MECGNCGREINEEERMTGKCPKCGNCWLYSKGITRPYKLLPE